ncbi:MAG: thioesterase, partial [Spirochaetia bacterium]|nr:thioesterase [Spirochaetia bacterium]
MDRNKIEQNHTVYYYNVDQFHNLTMSSLVNYYTEIALAHTIKAGISFKYLNERNLYWVLYKMRIKVSRYPKLYEKIRIGTEGYNLIKFNAYRKYRMIDESGIVISEAEGIFMLLDSVKMRPAKMPDEMYDGYGVARGNNSRLEIDSLK